MFPQFNQLNTISISENMATILEQSVS